MTDNTDNTKNQTPVSVGEHEGGENDSAVNVRRALLKGAVATMPMILSLQSGAALARSSNIIFASRPRSATDAEGRLLCLDYRFVQDATGGDSDSGYRHGHAVDVGEPPYVHITAIRRRRYHRSPAGDEVRTWRMCQEGGIFHYEEAGWKETRYVYKGMLVSATTMTSLVGHMDITEI